MRAPYGQMRTVISEEVVGQLVYVLAKVKVIERVWLSGPNGCQAFGSS